MSAAPQRLVAALDLGSTRTVAVVAEATGDSREPLARILGVGIERTAGMRRGVVRDIEETTRAITKAMADAQRMAGVEVGTVYCGIAGEHVAGRSSHGMVSVTGDEIRTGDVARVNDMASNVSFGRDHELLHAIPQDYIVDQQPGISEPIGMTGSRLEAEVYLVTVLSSVAAEPAAGGGAGGLSRRGVRARAARGVAGGAHARRAGAGLCHRGARRRLDQRLHLPRRQDPAYRVAAVRGRARHRRSSCTACRSRSRTPSGSRSDSGRRTSRWCRKTTSSSCRARRDRAPGARTAGSSRISMHMRLQEVLEYALDEITRAGYHQRLPAGVILTGGGAQAARHRRAGAARCSPCRSGWACRGRGSPDWRTAWSRRGWRCLPGWCCTARGNWRSAAASAAAAPRPAGGKVSRSSQALAAGLLLIRA